MHMGTFVLEHINVIWGSFGALFSKLGHNFGRNFFLNGFLALFCATAQQSYCRHAGVRRPSVRRP